MFDNILPIKDPVLIFALLMSISLVAPLLSEKLKLPGIIGLIITGIILGPHALGVLERGREIELLASVGLLYIMFLAGLELDRVQFMKHRSHSLVFGLFTFLFPLSVGSVLARFFLGFSWESSILLASMFSSHTLLTYPIASRLGLSRQRAVTTTIGGTIFTDTAALMVLAIIAAIHKGDTSIFFWPLLFTYISIYVAAMIFFIPKMSKWFFRKIASDGVIAFSGIIATVYLSSYLAYAAGLEPIIGAFLAGLLLNSFIPQKSALMNRIQFVGHSLFIPFFLISVGMLVNLGVLLERSQTLVIAGFMVAAGLVTKWLAALATRKALRYNSEEGMLIFGLSVNQAAATLAAVLVGYNLGIFTEAVLTGTIIMIMLTSLTGSWLTDRYARKVALKEEEEPFTPSENLHRILIPIADEETAKELMNLAMLLRRTNSDEPLYPLRIAQSGENTDEHIVRSEKLLGHAVVQALEADVPVVPVVRAAIDATVGIKQAVIDLRITAIIAAWKGVSASHSFTFGRTIDSVLNNTSQMMIVSRCSIPVNTMKRVILAVPPLIDRQPGFVTALSAIKRLAKQLDATLSIVSVPPTIDKVRKASENMSPRVQESYTALNDWAELLPWIEKSSNRDRDDMLVFASVRKGRLAWQPKLEQLPRTISSRLPGTNFAMIYPADAAPEKEPGRKGPSRFKDLSFFPADHIRLDLDDADIARAIPLLLEPSFPNNKAVIEKVSSQLLAMARTEPMQLFPGAILLHAHISEVKKATAFLGINSRGWEVPHISGEVRALFILLSSKESSPENHLKALADLVRPLHHFHTTEKLTQSSSVEEVLKLFSSKKQESSKG